MNPMTKANETLTARPPLPPSFARAYRVLANWRHDILAAGFRPKGAPLAAWRAMTDASRRGEGVAAALRLARDVFADWAKQTPYMAEMHEPVVAALDSDIAALE